MFRALVGSPSARQAGATRHASVTSPVPATVTSIAPSSPPATLTSSSGKTNVETTPTPLGGESVGGGGTSSSGRQRKRPWAATSTDNEVTNEVADLLDCPVVCLHSAAQTEMETERMKCEIVLGSNGYPNLSM
jgi:hypothetical protein